jgi:Mg-chelatase subunit ChlD
MTRERKQDLAIGALVVSILLHVGAMIFMRPQVMTKIPPGKNNSRVDHIKITPSKLEKAKLTAVSSIEDVKAQRPAPTPESAEKDPLPSQALMPDSEKVKALLPTLAVDVPLKPKSPLPIIPVTRNLPHEAEKNVLSPKAVMECLVVPKIEGGKPKSDDAARVDKKMEMPIFADLSIPKLAIKEKSPPLLPKKVKEEIKFVPDTKVRKTVDEKAVEIEKAAVRDLLDGTKAEELSNVVTIECSAMDEGNWTYFKVRAKPSDSLETVPKDVVILLDASGSIGKMRLKSCRDAVADILRSCINTSDRFNLVVFRDKFSYAFETWKECTRESFDAADYWLSQQAAFGRTDVFATIRSVLTLPRNPERPLIALVVTDGIANAGLSGTADILSRFTSLNDGLVSVYMYGVMNAANRELINMLTRGNRGESFVFDGYKRSAGSRLESLGERFRDPLISDLRLVFAGRPTPVTYPRLLKNMYRRGFVEFVGRVPRGTKKVSFSLKGLSGKKPYESFYTINFATVKRDLTVPGFFREEESIDRRFTR